MRATDITDRDVKNRPGTADLHGARSLDAHPLSRADQVDLALHGLPATGAGPQAQDVLLPGQGDPMAA